MNTAKAIPRPAIVTNPPPWANNDGAPAILAMTGPEDVVAEDEVPFFPFWVDEAVVETLPEPADLVEFPPAALPVAVAVAIDIPDEGASVAEVDLVFDALLDDEEESCATTEPAARAKKRRLEYCMLAGCLKWKKSCVLYRAGLMI